MKNVNTKQPVDSLDATLYTTLYKRETDEECEHKTDSGPIRCQLYPTLPFGGSSVLENLVTLNLSIPNTSRQPYSSTLDLVWNKSLGNNQWWVNNWNK